MPDVATVWKRRWRSSPAPMTESETRWVLIQNRSSFTRVAFIRGTGTISLLVTFLLATERLGEVNTVIKGRALEKHIR